MKKCTNCGKKVKKLIEIDVTEIDDGVYEEEYYCRSCHNKLKTKLNDNLEFTRKLFNV